MVKSNSIQHDTPPQLNLYGFRRITKGPDAGAYRHEMFHRDNPDRCLQMKRTKQKGSSSPQLRPSPRTGSISSSPLSPDTSPSAYTLEPATLSQSAPSVLSGNIMGRYEFCFAFCFWFLLVWNLTLFQRAILQSSSTFACPLTCAPVESSALP